MRHLTEYIYEAEKNTKWYQNMLLHGISTAVSVIADVIEKYGKQKNRKYIPAKSDNEFRNCRIDGIGINNKGEVYLDIYWQGDGTDGNDVILLSELMNTNKVVIPASYDGKYMNHGKLEVDKKWLWSVFKSVANYIDPKNLNDRENKEHDRETRISIMSELNDYFYNNYHKNRWGDNPEYDNGWPAVRKYIEDHWKELMKETSTKRLEIVKPIFFANSK